MLVTSPFLLHLTMENPQGDGYATAVHCVESAIQAVQTARDLDDHGAFDDAYSFTLYGLVFAATTLLVVEFGALSYPKTNAVETASRGAEHLLGKLATVSPVANECLESLQVSNTLRRALFSADVYDEAVVPLCQSQSKPELWGQIRPQRSRLADLVRRRECLHVYEGTSRYCVSRTRHRWLLVMDPPRSLRNDSIRQRRARPSRDGTHMYPIL